MRAERLPECMRGLRSLAVGTGTLCNFAYRSAWDDASGPLVLDEPGSSACGQLAGFHALW